MNQYFALIANGNGELDDEDIAIDDVNIKQEEVEAEYGCYGLPVEVE